MAQNSKVDWLVRPGTVPVSLNPVTGCDKVSPGCGICYAMGMSPRLKAIGDPRYQRDGNPVTSGPGFGVSWHPQVLTSALAAYGSPRRRPRTCFLPSMGDLFHREVSPWWLASTVAAVGQLHADTVITLTKRPHLAARALADPGLPGRVQAVSTPGHPQYLPGLSPRDGLLRLPLTNWWLGTSVETARYLPRVDDLRHCPAVVRVLSLEPLLGPVADGLDLAGVGWVLIGGESGPGAHRLDLQWIRDVIVVCRHAGVPVFVKQLGTVAARALGERGKGNHPATWPADLQVREYPR